MASVLFVVSFRLRIWMAARSNLSISLGRLSAPIPSCCYTHEFVIYEESPGSRIKSLSINTAGPILSLCTGLALTWVLLHATSMTFASTLLAPIEYHHSRACHPRPCVFSADDVVLRIMLTPSMNFCHHRIETSPRSLWWSKSCRLLHFQRAPTSIMIHDTTTTSAYTGRGRIRGSVSPYLSWIERTDAVRTANNGHICYLCL